MPQYVLQLNDVNARFEQVRGVAMPQAVAGNLFFSASCCTTAFIAT